MMRFSAMAASGVFALIAFKLFVMFVLPVFAAAFGILMLVLKWGAILGIGYLVWSLIRGRKKTAEVH